MIRKITNRYFVRYFDGDKWKVERFNIMPKDHYKEPGKGRKEGSYCFYVFRVTDKGLKMIPVMSGVTKKRLYLKTT